MQMADNSLANMILKSAGIYSDEQFEWIAGGREVNPGMGITTLCILKTPLKR